MSLALKDVHVKVQRASGLVFAFSMVTILMLCYFLLHSRGLQQPQLVLGPNLSLFSLLGLQLVLGSHLSLFSLLGLQLVLGPTYPC